MTKDENYKRYVTFFISGIVLILIGSGLQEGDYLLEMITTSMWIDLVPITMQGLGIYLTVRSIFYYIRYDLEERYGIHEWGHIKQSIDFFTKSSAAKEQKESGNGEKETISDSKAKDELQQFQDIFTGRLRMSHIANFREYSIIFSDGDKGDKIGPLTSDNHLIIIVLRGNMCVETENDEVYIERGEGFHLLPGIERTTYFLSDRTEALLIQSEG